MSCHVFTLTPARLPQMMSQSAQCVTVCCGLSVSWLQCVAVCCRSVLQCMHANCLNTQTFATDYVAESLVCCSVLQCVAAVCRSVLMQTASTTRRFPIPHIMSHSILAALLTSPSSSPRADSFSLETHLFPSLVPKF